jgi:hypothetical protein
VIDRRTFLALVPGSLLAAPLASEAQQAPKIPRIEHPGHEPTCGQRELPSIPEPCGPHGFVTPPPRHARYLHRATQVCISHPAPLTTPSELRVTEAILEEQGGHPAMLHSPPSLGLRCDTELDNSS